MYKIVCTQCGARIFGGERYLGAREKAEDHARLTGHWGKVCLWRLGGKGEVCEPVRVIVEPGRWRNLGRRKRMKAA